MSVEQGGEGGEIYKSYILSHAQETSSFIRSTSFILILTRCIPIILTTLLDQFPFTRTTNYSKSLSRHDSEWFDRDPMVLPDITTYIYADSTDCWLLHADSVTAWHHPSDVLWALVLPLTALPWYGKLCRALIILHASDVDDTRMRRDTTGNPPNWDARRRPKHRIECDETRLEITQIETRAAARNTLNVTVWSRIFLNELTLTCVLFWRKLRRRVLGSILEPNSLCSSHGTASSKPLAHSISTERHFVFHYRHHQTTFQHTHFFSLIPFSCSEQVYINTMDRNAVI
jgi:hypothetical protein